MTPPTPPILDGFTEADLTGPEAITDLLDLDAWAFPTSVEVSELASWPWPLEPARTRAWRPDGATSVAAMHGSYPFTHFPVPGATTPAAGLTWVGVHPQYRRRGLLRAMIEAHFADCLARGEAFSVLTASEPAIYGRFGYGLASRTASVNLKRGAKLRPVAGSELIHITFEIFDFAQHAEIVHRLHAAVGSAELNRPGWALRETAQLRDLVHHNPPALRDGFEGRRILLAHRDDEVVGYALFARKLDWGDSGADGTVVVAEYVGIDGAVTHALWSRLLDLDLTTSIRQRLLPLDDPLLALLVDLRAATPRISDNLWVRLIDVPAALTARRYAADLDVRIGVSDSELPANQAIWHLQAEAFSNNVQVSAATQADIELDVRELGALYLGGTSAVALNQAGLLTGGATPVKHVDTAFGWPMQPATSWIF